MSNINIFNFENLSFSFRNLFSKWKKKMFDKSNTQILFIDDVYFPVVDNLEKAGWSVKRVKDIKNIQDEDLQRSHVVFVDYKGVGKTLSESEEGVGIIKAIKKNYGNSKRVILYSAYSRFRLGSHLGVADNQLSKESDTYEFIAMIESEIKKLR